MSQRPEERLAEAAARLRRTTETAREIAERLAKERQAEATGTQAPPAPGGGSR